MSLANILLASVAVGGVAAQAPRLLAPTQDINFLPGENAANPLQSLGANGPWFAGPDVNGVSSDVPENCYVDQAAYVLRHGSRYPDTGAYNGWVSMQSRFQTGNYTASGSLSFLPSWKTVLTNPSLQIAMQSPTGYKEAFDLGYTLRTRYPDLYQEGDQFIVWANNYTRVLQTARNFVRGFLGTMADDYGNVISVTSKGFSAATGDSLAPSDLCPNFKDTEGGDNTTIWNNVWVPAVQARLQSLISGNLTLTASDITQIPYLCGFESQITGRLSPWCDIFTEDELKSYDYFNSLRYWYGVGPGTNLPQKMMTPFLNALVGLLHEGPGINGTAQDGSAFELPNLLVSFLNDGQLTELVSASGIFDSQAKLDPKVRDDHRLFVASHFITMRGTIAFERLNCKSTGSTGPSSSHPSSGKGGASTKAQGGCGGKHSSTTSTKAFGTSAPYPTATGAPFPPQNGTSANSTYIRIRLNDAVYPVPSCKSGPGKSCLLSDYVKYIAQKYETQGDWLKNCGVTDPAAPTKVKGASFFTNLSSPWLSNVAP